MVTKTLVPVVTWNARGPINELNRFRVSYNLDFWGRTKEKDFK